MMFSRGPARGPKTQQDFSLQQEGSFTPQEGNFTPQEGFSEHLASRQCPYCLSPNTGISVFCWTSRIAQCGSCGKQWLLDVKGEIVGF